MMYRILRNNKEQGPFNLDELLQLSLRPYDLIWVEGKSASWQYPTEINSLVPYLNEKPVKNVITQTLPFPTVQPFINTDTAGPVTESPTQEENTLTAEILEQKANAIYQRIQAYNVQCEQEAKNVQTKYARSLEELKQDYADWLHKKKKRNRGLALDNKGWMALGGMCSAFIIFIVAGRSKETAPIVSDKIIYTSSSTAEGKDPYTTSKINHALLPVNNQKYLPKLSNATNAFIDSVRTVLNTTIPFKKAVIVEPVTTKRKTSPLRQADTQVVLAVTPVAIKDIPQPAIRTVNLEAHYVKNESNSRIKELKLTLSNTGNVILKQVPVEVFYYKKGKQLFDKEILYFTNMNPGSSYTLTQPGNKKAFSARFEIGQLTSEE